MDKSKKKKRTPIWRKAHFWKLSFVYFVVFLMILLIIDYYALMLIPALWVVGASALLGLVSGWIHYKKRWHDNLDIVAEELL